MDVRKLFGLNMRRYRMARGSSQEALGIKMGVDRAHVSSMERGLQNVTLLTLAQAADALGVEPSAMLNESTAGTLLPASGKVPRKPRTKPPG